jgi:cell division protein FtsX
MLRVMTRVAAVLLLALTPALAASPPEILVSRQLLASRGLAVGDLVRLSAAPDGSEAREFRIAGTYEPVADPLLLNQSRFEVRLHLPDLLDLTATGEDPLERETVSRINVGLVEGADPAAYVDRVKASIPGVSAVPAEGADDDARVFAVLRRFHWAIAAVTVLGSTAFLLALTVMRAEERRETVGILRLIGISRRSVLTETFLEGLLVAAAGSVFGVALALAGQGAFNRFFQWYYDTPLVFMRVTPSIAATCLAIALPLGIVAGVVASWTLLRREVLELLRR